MVILEDKGQKIGMHEIKNMYFSQTGIQVHRCPLPVGDYVLLTDKAKNVLERKHARKLEVKKMDLLGTYSVSVDTKEDIRELYSNLIQGHARFRDECVLAQNNNIKLVILIENTWNITSLENFNTWKNPQFQIWETHIRSIFIKHQKEIFNLEKELKYLLKESVLVPEMINQDRYSVWRDQVRKLYIKQLRVAPIHQIEKYLQLNKIKLKKRPVDNLQLISIMKSMQEKYGVEFLFCKPEESGLKVLKILNDK